MLREPKEPRADFAPILAMVMGSAILGFVAGAVVIETGWFPYLYVHTALVAGRALFDSEFAYESGYDSSLWHESRYETTGTVRNDPAKSNPGLTLFTSSHAPSAFLIAADGSVVHQWDVPPGLVTGRHDPDPFTYLRKAYLFPNGDLLTFFEKVDVTPGGLAMVRVDMDSNLVWSYERPLHHDFDVAPDGKIYALDRTIVREPFSGLPPEYFPLLDDEVVILSERGEELGRLSISKALAETSYRRLLQLFNPNWRGDLLHVNAIKFVTASIAEAFPFLRENQVVVSIREGNMIAAIDVDKKAVTWAVHGYWLRQHDIDLLPNGHFLLFDNQGDFGPAGMSRVLEIDAQTMGIVWQYGGDVQNPLGSRVRSSQERLANGNTLITESDQGRLLEVTRDGEIVWEFRSPWRSPKDSSFTSVLSWATRVDPNDFEGAFAAKIRAALGTS